MRKQSFKLFDAVAILEDLPDRKIVYGQVGTIIEILSDGVFEVEFSNKTGETIAEFAVKEESLLLLHHEIEYSEK